MKVLAFFLGFFIVLAFSLNLSTLFVKNKCKNVENFTVSSPVSSSSNVDLSILPNNNYKYMLLNTFSNKISQNDMKWYDNNIDTNNININQPNNNKYFNFTSVLNYIPNTINANGSKSVNISGIELKGPNAFYFGNNTTYEIDNFSIFMCLKINSFKSDNNILLELIANTISTTINDLPLYLANSININFIKTTDPNNYNVSVRIADNTYTETMTNINKDIILNVEPNYIGIVYNANNIKVFINNNEYTFTNLNKNKIILGTEPIVINKNGNIDANIYSIVYYKKDLTFADFTSYKSYNNYYISGTDYLNKQNTDTQNRLNNVLSESQNNKSEIDKLKEDIAKCSADKSNILNDKPSKELSIPKIDKLEIEEKHENEEKHNKDNLLDDLYNVLLTIKDTFF